MDDEAVYAILFIAQKNLELEELVSKAPAPRARTGVASPDKWNNVRGRLSALTQRVQTSRPHYVFDKATKETVLEWEPIPIYEEPAAAESVAEFGTGEEYKLYLRQLVDEV